MSTVGKLDYLYHLDSKLTYTKLSYCKVDKIHSK